MSLREMGQDGRVFDVSNLSHQNEFDRVWLSMSLAERTAIEAEINQRLDELVAVPNPNWGSITNTSIEGGKTNPNTGVRGDWSGTVFHAIFVACGLNEELAGMFLRQCVEESHH
jgi:hypothetical protein